MAKSQIYEIPVPSFLLQNFYFYIAKYFETVLLPKQAVFIFVSCLWQILVLIMKTWGYKVPTMLTAKNGEK